MTDLTGYIDTKPAAFEPQLRLWCREGLTPAQAGLLRERAIRLLAAGSAAAMIDESLMLLNAVGGCPSGDTFDYGMVSGLHQLLADAARPAGPFKVALIQREYKLAFGALIELLSLNGSMTPASIQQELDTKDAMILLSKMHEAGLVSYTNHLARRVELTVEGYRLA